MLVGTKLYIFQKCWNINSPMVGLATWIRQTTIGELISVHFLIGLSLLCCRVNGWLVAILLLLTCCHGCVNLVRTRNTRTRGVARLECQRGWLLRSRLALLALAIRRAARRVSAGYALFTANSASPAPTRWTCKPLAVEPHAVHGVTSPALTPWTGELANQHMTALFGVALCNYTWIGIWRIVT